MTESLDESSRLERAEFLAWSLEKFERFAALVDIIPKGGAKQKLILNEVQRIYCSERTQRDVVLKPRQVGFTTMEQARDIYHFLTVPGARVVVTCQSITGNGPTKELSKNYRVMFESLRRAGLDLPFSTESNTSWVLGGRDSTLRIVEAGASEAAAAKKGRAGTISRLHLTETAFYEFADDTLNAMLECVPNERFGSEIVSESTPNGAAGFFYRQCTEARKGNSQYKFHFYPWYIVSEYEIPLVAGDDISPRNEREELLLSWGITGTKLKWYRSKVADKGQDKTDQEYPSDPETCFLVSGRQFFDGKITDTLIERKHDPIERRDQGRVLIWKKRDPSRRYVMAADTSSGAGADLSAATVRDVKTGEHCATIYGRYSPWDFAKALVTLATEYNEAFLAVESNNHGHAVLQALERQHRYERLYSEGPGKPGWTTNAITRPEMLGALEDAHRNGLWITNHGETLEQFRTFIVNQNGKPEASSGNHDDLVIAEAICWAVRQEMPPEVNYRPRVTLGGSFERSAIGLG